MRVRLHVEDEQDARTLLTILGRIEQADRFPAWHARVKLRDGREVFGPFGRRDDGTFYVGNDWNPHDDPELRHLERRAGWTPGQNGLRIEPCEVVWFEYVPESSAAFVPPH